MSNNIISTQLTNLVSWTHAPEPDTLQDILSALSQGDLMMAMAFLKRSPAGRLAWAEYGRRAGFVDFSVRSAIMNGKVGVTFEGEALPIHHGPIIRKIS